MEEINGFVESESRMMDSNNSDQDVGIDEQYPSYPPDSQNEDSASIGILEEDPDYDHLDDFIDMDEMMGHGGSEIREQLHKVIVEKDIKMRDSMQQLLEDQRKFLEYSYQELAPAFKANGQNWTRINEEMMNLKGENEALKREVIEAEAKISKQENKEKEQVDRLESNIKELCAKNEILEVELSAARSDLSQLEILKKDMSEAESKFNQQMVKENEKIQELESDKLKLMSQVDELESNLNQQKTQEDETLKQKLSEAESKFNQQLDRESEKIQELESDKLKLMSQVEGLEFNLSQQKILEKELVSQLVEKNKQKKMELDDKTRSMQHKDEEMKILHDSINEMQKNLEEKDTSLTLEKSKLTDAENENAKLTGLLASREKTEQKGSSVLKQMEATIQELKLKLNDAEKKIEQEEMRVGTLEKQIWCGLKVEAYRAELDKNTGVSNKEALEEKLRAVMTEHQCLIEEADTLLKQGVPDSINQENNHDVLHLLQVIAEEQFFSARVSQEENGDPEVYEDAQEVPLSRDNNHPVPVPRRINPNMEIAQVNEEENDMEMGIQQQLLEDIVRQQLPQDELIVECPMCFVSFLQCDLQDHVDNCYNFVGDDYDSIA
ncbi:putative leucine-rich repeat-containing protein DDB_G0290503 isoform X2 [Cloeon dipterum]|uniref:putative leucine-rich repeat-containing protein DDB_G0290503 isoform X2 n=1 Tax=Cloeon dipterum TaxID=197152 RepID=UPI00321FA5C7